MGLNQNIKHWLPVILCMAFIFWMSTDTFSSRNTSLIIEPALRLFAPGISPQGIETVHGLIRKCAHIAEYFILGSLLFRSFRLGSMGTRAWRWAFYSMIVVVLYAVSDEFHQSFVSTRTASIFDVGFDSIGGIIAQVMSVLWHQTGCNIKKHKQAQDGMSLVKSVRTPRSVDTLKN